jgi:hypothetical protein
MQSVFYSKCCHFKCRFWLSIILLNGIMLSVIMLSVVMLNDVILIIVKPSVNMLSMFFGYMLC